MGVLQVPEDCVALDRFGESNEPGEVVMHLQVSVAVDALAHRHLAALVHDLGPHLLGLAFDLRRLHISSLSSQVVAGDAEQGKGEHTSVNGC